MQVKNFLDYYKYADAVPTVSISDLFVNDDVASPYAKSILHSLSLALCRHHVSDSYHGMCDTRMYDVDKQGRATLLGISLYSRHVLIQIDSDHLFSLCEPFSVLMCNDGHFSQI